MTERIIPGKSAGRLTLGMPREAVIGLLGKPTHTYRVKRRPPEARKASDTSYQNDVWEKPNGPWIAVVTRQNRVIQIALSRPDYATAEGISPATPFSKIRTAYPHMTVRDYGFLGLEPDSGGYIGILIDDIRRGITFMTGTQDDAGTYEALPKLTPGTIFIHTPGTPALPIEDEEMASPSKPFRGSYIPAIRAWFAGAPHRPSSWRP